MKQNGIIAVVGITVLACATVYAMWGQSTSNLKKGFGDGDFDKSPKIALAYVVDRYKELPNPDYYSHLIYSFAVFNDSCDGVEIKYPEKLRGMSDLKKQNPDLKVILGVGGYRREGFSEMARDKKKRKSFVKNVNDIIKTYNLDGVDLDWEFPTTEAGGHTATPHDDRNYVTLVKDLRKALGKDKWISYYSNNSGQWIDHKGMVPYVDYVHVSGYNLAIPKEGERLLHQSPLYPSPKTGDWCVEKAIERHMKLGVPREKVLMGIPFFGRGLKPFPSIVDCLDLAKYSGNLKVEWDNDAKAPYYADKDGNLILGFDDERSITEKFDFIRTNDLPGIFVWSYESDYEDNRLSKTIYKLRK